jgi:hypothetical protein
VAYRDTVSPRTPARRFLRRGLNTVRGKKTLKVTIDSTEPLADALRVIGALYNVNLAQVSATDDTTPTTAGAAQDQPLGAATAKPSRNSRAKTTSAPTRTGRRRRTAGASSSDVRAWAVANGHAVSDRGTLPAAIKAAYAQARQS